MYKLTTLKLGTDDISLCVTRRRDSEQIRYMHSSDVIPNQGNPDSFYVQTAAKSRDQILLRISIRLIIA